MKKQISTSIISCVISLVVGLAPSSCFSREFSKSGTVFQDVKDGVVTVFSSTGYGSGFLVDSSGLILTNSHVVNEKAGHLRVKFGPNQVVEATILEKDRDNDMAVLAVNLKNIGAVKPLPIFTPSNEPLAIEGEKVIAIGSPADKYRADRTMSEGVVGKVKDNLIFHDASISHGSSGGPLLNFDGQVIGLNTGSKDRLLAAVSITPAKKLIDSAREQVVAGLNLKADLMPDFAEIDYPIGEFQRSKPEIFKNRKQSNYNFSSNYFLISVFTPPQYCAQLRMQEEHILKRRKLRAKKKGFTISDDEYESKNRANYDDKEPVVTIMVFPNPKLTAGSKAFSAVTLVTAATATVLTAGIAAPTLAVPFMYQKKEYKKDFLSMSLVDESGTVAAVPIETGRLPYDKNIAILTDYSYTELVDKAYYGRYKFDPRVFETDKRLKLVLSSEGDHKTISVSFPQKLQKQIVDDFRLYWNYVKEQEGRKIVPKSD